MRSKLVTQETPINLGRESNDARLFHRFSLKNVMGSTVGAVTCIASYRSFRVSVEDWPSGQDDRMIGVRQALLVARSRAVTAEESSWRPRFRLFSATQASGAIGRWRRSCTERRDVDPTGISVKECAIPGEICHVVLSD
jgi:hypothetical protein